MWKKWRWKKGVVKDKLYSAWMLPCDPSEAMFNVLIDAKVLIVVVGESDIEDDHVEGDNGKVIVVKVIYCLTGE